MKPLVFLLEEPSMKEFLDFFIPRAFPEVDFLCVKHEGKQDLEKSIPRKLRAWGIPHPHFIIIRDNDQDQCRKVKRNLKELCRKGGRPDALIRIACQELEAWYLGSLETLASVYTCNELLSFANKRKYKDPDHLASPSHEISQIIPEFRKIDGARRMGQGIPIDEDLNRSDSFKVFIKGLRRILSA
jgi:hypothetical protein